MLVLKIIIAILALVFLGIARYQYENNGLRISLASTIFAILSGLLAITLCGLIAFTAWNIFIIPKILFFASACLYILFCNEFYICVPFWIALLISIIALVVCSICYCGNITKCEAPNVETIYVCDVICATDNSSISGSISGGIFYVHGSISEKDVYKYYYKLNDGGVRLGSIPAESTTLYFIKSGKQAYLEKVVTTTYFMNNNHDPAKQCLESSTTTYKLYVPEGSVTDVYEFDAE